jgi:hypothetical protein
MRRALAPSLLFALAAALPAYGQAPAPAPAPAASAPERGSAAAVDAVRQAVRTDKKGLVEKNLQLTEAEAKKFWPLYESFQKDIDRVQKRKNRVVLDYVNSESSMTDANAKNLAKEFLAASAEEQKVAEAQMKKVSGVLPPRKAVRYMQIENKIRVLGEYDTAAQVPLVR